jgi:beta-phosphoglucomutase
MKNRLAIFDLDGTLFDTKDVNFYSYQLALKEFGYDLDYEYFCNECNGMNYKEFLPKIIKDSSVSLNDIHRIKKELYSSNLKHARINENLFNIIELIKEKHYIAIVTTASRKNCEEILEYFNKKELFDLILAQEDIKELKPNPSGFIQAMSFFDIEPKSAFIFEDSLIGIEAAQKSGASVFVVNKF